MNRPKRPDASRLLSPPSCLSCWGGSATVPKSDFDAAAWRAIEVVMFGLSSHHSGFTRENLQSRNAGDHGYE